MSQSYSAAQARIARLQWADRTVPAQHHPLTAVERRRHELSDAEWEFVRPLLPESSRGRKQLGDRRVLNRIVWKFRTGVA